jgi:hypothetical protein
MFHQNNNHHIPMLVLKLFSNLANGLKWLEMVELVAACPLYLPFLNATLASVVKKV